MKILQRHIFGQVALSVALSVGLFVFVLVLGSLFKETFPLLSSGKIDWGQFFEVMALTIPSVLPYSLPMGVLAGILIVLGRMSAQNEILAMRAAGMSLWRIVSPIFFIAFLATLLSAAINLEQAPRAIDASKAILSGSIRTNPARFIAPGEFAKFNQYTIYAGERDGDLFKNVWIWELNGSGQAVRIIHARTAHITYDSAAEVLKLTANDASMEELDRGNPEQFTDTTRFHRAGLLPVEISVDALLRTTGHRRKLRHLNLSTLLDLRKTGFQLDEVSRRDPKKVFINRVQVQFQIQNNLASALGILSMTILAIPLGIKTSRSETFVNLAIALVLALSYYVLSVAVSWVPPAYRPDILIWFPNFLFQAIGGFLFWKAAKQ